MPESKSIKQQSAIQNPLLGYAFILGAACMWGTIGIFFSVLHYNFGMSALTIGVLRAGIAALLLALALGLWKRDALRFERTLLPPLLLFGLFGIAAFYVLNTEAVFLTNVATASVLLYTAPAFVTLLARRLWREPLTRRKIVAVVASFVGCTLVARVYAPNALALNGWGVLIGAAAGLTYGMFTLFSKYFSTRASPWTTVLYSLVFGTLFLLPLQFVPLPGVEAPNYSALFEKPLAWAALLGLCLGPTLGSYALYNAGLRAVSASGASVIATIEPVVAGMAGFVVFGQTLEVLQIAGAIIIVAAALALTVGLTPEPQETVARIDG
jgi:drug/metabolite transporter (DMT)-like permease